MKSESRPSHHKSLAGTGTGTRSINEVRDIGRVV